MADYLEHSGFQTFNQEWSLAAFGHKTRARDTLEPKRLIVLGAEQPFRSLDILQV